MNQQVKQWLDYAAQDLGVARHLFENYHQKLCLKFLHQYTQKEGRVSKVYMQLKKDFLQNLDIKLPFQKLCANHQKTNLLKILYSRFFVHIDLNSTNIQR